MIDMDKIAAGIAAELLRKTSILPDGVERIVCEAFRRGVQLGLSLRDGGALTGGPADPSTKPASSPSTPMQ